MRFIDWLRGLLGLHVHDRRLFLIGNYCVVKCTTCGMESIPWEATEISAENARPYHLNDAEEMAEIDRRVRERRKR